MNSASVPKQEFENEAPAEFIGMFRAPEVQKTELVNEAANAVPQDIRKNLNRRFDKFFE